MNDKAKDEISIPLPSLIHRIGREAVKHAQTLALHHHCELKRVRRSRNWSLEGRAPLVQQCYLAIKAKNTNSEFTFLLKKLDEALVKHSDKLEPLEAKLKRLVAENPAITLAELMSVTECTLAEARIARFEAEL
ncbi:ribosome recycling factor family protein [Shewanella sp. A25]|nr:ribosome recycling factor family protein [Shewanella shenzhenensis]